MNRLQRMLGVTLLEIMLVLAIAAMVIVMSVRYYQSASVSQQTNATLEQIQAITAAVDSLAQGTGDYTKVASADLINLVAPGQTSILSPWGSAITFTPGSASTYTVAIAGMSAGVCSGLKARLAANNHYTVSATCSGSNINFQYTYTSNV